MLETMVQRVPRVSVNSHWLKMSLEEFDFRSVRSGGDPPAEEPVTGEVVEEPVFQARPPPVVACPVCGDSDTIRFIVNQGCDQSFLDFTGYSSAQELASHLFAAHFALTGDVST